MNSRHIIGLLATLGVVAGGVYITGKNREAKVVGKQAAEIGQKVFKDVNFDEADTITVKSAKEEVTLVKANDIWGVKQRDGYPAAYEFVRDLAIKLQDLKILETGQVGASKLGRLQLIAPGSAEKVDEKEIGTLILFSKGDQEVAKITIGKMIETSDSQDSPFGFNLNGGQGRYIQPSSVKDGYFKVKEAFSSLNTDVRQWLDKQFIAPSGGLKDIGVQVTDRADLSWKVSKEKEGVDPVLVDKKTEEEANVDNLKSATSAFSSAYFNDVGVAADKDKQGLEKPIRTVMISYFDGFSYTGKIGSKVKPEDEASDFYFTLSSVNYAPTPAPIEPTVNVPEQPKASEVPAGETEEQKKAREAKDQEAQTKYDNDKIASENSKQRFADEKKRWDDTHKTNEERLTKEKAFEGKVYMVTKFTVDWFLKDRPYFLKDKNAPTPAPENNGASATTPPIEVKVPPTPTKTEAKLIEATTPPISVDSVKMEEAKTPEPPKDTAPEQK